MHESTALVATVMTGGFIALLPKLAEVRQAPADSEIADDLHTGMTIGAVFVVAIAGFAAFADKNPMTLVAAVIAVTALILGYEFVLRTNGVIVR